MHGTCIQGSLDECLSIIEVDKKFQSFGHRVVAIGNDHRWITGQFVDEGIRVKKVLKSIFRAFNLETSASKPFVRRLYQFRQDVSAASIIDTALLVDENWERRGTNIGDGSIKALFRSAVNSHKWHHYFPIYEQIFAPLRAQPIKLLEVGVYKGASLRVWKEYFHPASTIVGIDINHSCKEFDSPSERVHVRIGKQQDKDFLARIIQEFGSFDLIIDDGSHIPSHMIASFNLLFDKGLKNEGIYFVEDTCTNYWVTYRDSKRSFMDFTKAIIDLMHAHYVNSPSESYFRLKSQNMRKNFVVPRITKLVDEVRVFDSVVVFYKSTGFKEPPVSEHL